jgi:nucleotide-binding universal stress UspA family protein
VGVDGSRLSQSAAVWAAHEAVSLGVALRLVHTWAIPIVATTGFAGAWVDPRLVVEAAEVVVDETASLVRHELGDRAPEIRTRIIQGDAAPTLIDASTDASMLVVGSRGRGGFASLILGSVSTACLHHSTVPTVVVDDVAGLPGSGDVMVGVDDSPGAAAALRWAAAEAGRLGVRLIVVHGSDIPNAMPPGGIVFGEVHRDAFFGAANHLMADMVEAAMSGLEVPPSAVELRPIELAATEALLSESKGAALLVVGSRGRGGFAGLLLGSVSQQCIHHAPCPVVVVPHPSEPED